MARKAFNRCWPVSWIQSAPAIVNYWTSWIVLAKEESTLGILAKPTVDQVLAFGTKNQELINLLRKYGQAADASEVINKEWSGADLSVEEFERRHGSQSSMLFEHSRRSEVMKQHITLGDLTAIVFGSMFHRPIMEEGIGAYRDSDKHWPLAAMHAPNWLKSLLWAK